MSGTIVTPIPGRPRGAARFAQFVDYLFWLLYTLLAIRLVLVFFDARAWTGFYRFVRVTTDPFVGPFRGIVGSPVVDEQGHIFAAPILVAIVAYALLQLAIHKLLRVVAYRENTL